MTTRIGGTGVGNSTKEAPCLKGTFYAEHSGYELSFDVQKKNVYIGMTEYHAGTLILTPEGLVDLLLKIVPPEDVKGIVAKLKK